MLAAHFSLQPVRKTIDMSDKEHSVKAQMTDKVSTPGVRRRRRKIETSTV